MRQRGRSEWKEYKYQGRAFGKYSEDGHAAASDASSDGCPAVGRQKYGLHGIAVHEIDDRILSWEGERCEMTADAAIDTYEDHRMAMAFRSGLCK